MLTAILIIGLAAYRVARFFAQEDGPWMISSRLRDSFLVFKCIHCCGFWIAVLLGLLWFMIPVTRYGIVLISIAGVVSVLGAIVSRAEIY